MSSERGTRLPLLRRLRCSGAFGCLALHDTALQKLFIEVLLYTLCTPFPLLCSLVFGHYGPSYPHPDPRSRNLYPDGLGQESSESLVSSQVGVGSLLDSTLGMWQRSLDSWTCSSIVGLLSTP